MNGFRPGREPRPSHIPPAPRKPHVHVLLLGASRERSGWLNHGLVAVGLTMVRDPRFTVTVESVLDHRNFDWARNYALDSARQKGADVCIQLDNDIVPPANLLDIVAQMDDRVQVCGLSYAMGVAGNLRLCCDNQQETYRDFVRVDTVATGCLIVKSKVWNAIRPPWFVWETKGELCEPAAGEDVTFCRKVREHGFTVWSHRQTCAHLHTEDQSGILALQMALQAASGK